MNALEDIKSFAVKAHSEVNHKYGTYPYSYHLQMVEDVAKKYIHLIPESFKDSVLSACWLHDTIEDCRLTYNDVASASSCIVADIVYALTNEKGKTRKDRANEKYYKGIISTPFARFVKICDRIANVKHSKKEGSRMFEVYKKENYYFVESLFGETAKNKLMAEYEELALDELQQLFLIKTK